MMKLYQYQGPELFYGIPQKSYLVHRYDYTNQI